MLNPASDGELLSDKNTSTPSVFVKLAELQHIPARQIHAIGSMVDNQVNTLSCEPSRTKQLEPSVQPRNCFEHLKQPLRRSLPSIDDINDHELDADFIRHRRDVNCPFDCPVASRCLNHLAQSRIQHEYAVR